MPGRGLTLAGALWLLPLALLLLAPAPCRADSDRSVIESSRRATGFVFTEFDGMISMGTGFCIDTSGLFITNNHVICDNGQYGRISVVLAPGTQNARILNATIVKADPNLDLALLRVDRSNNLHTVDLAGTGRMGRLHETQEVMALGYPFGLRLAAAGSAPEVSVSTGKITALRHVKGQLGLIQFDGSINHGNSGGPLLDQYGNVIGVVTAIVPDKQINFAIPVSFVRTLLAEANIVIAPAALTEPDIRAQLVDRLAMPPKGRLAAPDAAAQQSARKLVLDLFAPAYADKSKAGQEALVYQLLDEARSEKDDPSGCYALLNEAKEAAIRVGDFSAAVYAAGELFDKYDLRPTDLIADLLKRLGPGLDRQNAADGATVSLLLVEAFAKQLQFAEARKWIPSTREIAYASHNPKVVSAVAEGLARVEFDASAAEQADAALVKLKSAPNDIAANSSVGQYECFVRRDFAAGCAFLAKTDDAGLKSAAHAEIAKPATPLDQRACGDLWWDEATAQAKTPVVADACKARAVYWYRLAEPKLTGLIKRAVEQRLESQGLETANVAATRPVPPFDGAAWIDLLKVVDVARDAIAGKWMLTDGILSVNASPGIRKLQVPTQPSGAYEIHLEYEQPNQPVDDGSLNLALPVGSDCVVLIVTSQVMGLDTINGERFTSNETTRKGDFRDGKKHQLDITVTPAAGDAKISVSLDGQLQFDWSGPSSSLHPFWVWGNNSKGLCIGAWRSAHVITAFQLREQSPDPKSNDQPDGQDKGLPSVPNRPETDEDRPLRVSATDGWVRAGPNVEKGQCYRIVATGIWTDSEGQKCGPAGAAPEGILKLLGPQDISKEQREQFYCGQHPRGALICRIGDEKWDFYVPSDCRFLAPVSGVLSFRMNDDDRGSPAAKTGACAVTVSRIEPEWMRPDGSVAIIARIDSTDWLHITPRGVYWEWDGSWGKVGVQDGYYPTVINGIYWWPQWNSQKTTEPLKVPALWPAQPGRMRIIGIQAKRGDVDISHADSNEVIIHFHKHKGVGASQIGCVISTK